MKKKRLIVKVSASFDQHEQLFAFLKKYSNSNDEKYACWDEFAFTTDPVAECDAVLVFNNPSEKIQALCYPENVIAFMMEPGIYSEHPWMYKRLDQYARVYSPVKKSPNTVLSHGYLGWYLQQDWAFLSKLPVPEKKRDMSCIASDLARFKGHRLRLSFINVLREQLPQVDFFGRGVKFLPDKLEGILPYRFSIAMENKSMPHYFTEKINDCFLGYTVPVYYGCKNIGRYFPAKSFIKINIEEPIKAVKQIKLIIQKNDWEERIGALQEARQLVLDKYQPLAGAAYILRNTHPTEKKEILLKPVSSTVTRRIKNILGKVTRLKG